ncbi:HAD family phosphatase [uncultured Hoeflea sp.]|uniref:HAD family hydrolase n=1 Tax=uncultured Hoeflea sp. TaxID=538666 RepID=UPI0030D7F37B|tara:strand:- start:314 stop:1018 length:705 start_codon:yes stop_codon:yes gene_type:complete
MTDSQERLVIFDFDGVLIDSENIALEELRNCICAHGVEIDLAETRARFLGRSVADHMAFITERTGQPCPESFRSDWHDRLYSRYRRELQLVHGAAETLSGLDEAGIPYAIATGGAVERLDVGLECAGLTSRFAGRAFSVELVARGKPAPDIFIYTSEQLRMSAANCLVVEDSPHGIRGAVAAGMQTVGFVGASHFAGIRYEATEILSAAGADLVVVDHAALLDRILRWAGGLSD